MARKILGLLTGVALLAAGGQAFAQDGGAPPGVSWTGPYVSVGAGVGSFDHDLDVGSSVFENLSVIIPRVLLLNANGSIEDRSSFGDNDWNGFGTVALGYDQQIGSFVVGAFVDFDFHPDAESTSSKELSGSGNVSFLSIIGSDSIDFPLKANVNSNIDLDNVWSVGGRVGYLVQPTVLLYALGGYTAANIEGSATLSYDRLFNLLSSDEVSVDLPDRLQGYIVGGGGEVAVSKNLSLKLEYRYAHYGSESDSKSKSVDVTFSDGILLAYTRKLEIDTEVDADIHSVRGALVFRLNE